MDGSTPEYVPGPEELVRVGIKAGVIGKVKGNFKTAGRSIDLVLHQDFGHHDPAQGVRLQSREVAG